PLLMQCALSLDPAASTLPSFPTRRSSDLPIKLNARPKVDEMTNSVNVRFSLTRSLTVVGLCSAITRPPTNGRAYAPSFHHSLTTDRKSTRLNSSHVKNSYSDYCVNKKR